MNLRREARNRPCMVRIAGCTGGGEDTVLAHYRLAGTCGVGIKPPDILGAWACHYCHGIIDGRIKPEPYMVDIERLDTQLAHADAVLRTQYQLIQEGKL